MLKNLEEKDEDTCEILLLEWRDGFDPNGRNEANERIIAIVVGAVAEDATLPVILEGPGT